MKLFLNAPSGRSRLIAWYAGLVVLAFLVMFRTSTDAELALFSVAIIPLMGVAWVGGYKDGIWFAAIVATMWVVSDLLAERKFSAAWIPVLNALTRLAVYSLVAFLTAKVRLLLQREHELASYDTLTGLLNRRAFFELGEFEAGRSARYGHTLAVVFLDLDYFKKLNDSRGHEAGDNALKAVAMALRGALRTTDRVARLGGDEFAVLLPEIGYESAAEAGEKIATAANHSLEEFPPVSVSVGVAWFDGAGMGFPAMLQVADGLMYDIKKSGKHGVRTERFDSQSDISRTPPAS